MNLCWVYGVAQQQQQQLSELVIVIVIVAVFVYDVWISSKSNE